MYDTQSVVIEVQTESFTKKASHSTAVPGLDDSSPAQQAQHKQLAQHSKANHSFVLRITAQQTRHSYINITQPVSVRRAQSQCTQSVTQCVQQGGTTKKVFGARFISEFGRSQSGLSVGIIPRTDNNLLAASIHHHRTTHPTVQYMQP